MEASPAERAGETEAMEIQATAAGVEVGWEEGSEAAVMGGAGARRLQ